MMIKGWESYLISHLEEVQRLRIKKLDRTPGEVAVEPIGATIKEVEVSEVGASEAVFAEAMALEEAIETIIEVEITKGVGEEEALRRNVVSRTMINTPMATLGLNDHLINLTMF
jgi:hypothetical protein